MHSHGGDERWLWVALGLIGSFLVGEVTAALLADSLVLLADAAHMIVDVLALATAIAAARLARRPATGAWTFGLARAETLSAAVNGATLGVLAALIAIDAVIRLVHPHRVEGWTIVVVAIVGLAVNVVTVAVLHRADRSSINIRGAIAHIVTDAYGFAATIAAGIVVLATGWRRADAVASLLLVGLLLRAATTLLAESGRILLEAAPSHVDLTSVREHILGRDHVIDIHDLHVWTPTSKLPALSAHIVVSDDCFENGRAPQLLDELQHCLVGHFDVEHSTFQLEAAGHIDHELGAHA